MSKKEKEVVREVKVPKMVEKKVRVEVPDAVPEANGYILYDSRKCTGCKSCMLACSLAHEGKSILSLSRIQILSDPFGCYPNDVTVAVCRQCPRPYCMDVCPTGAIFIDNEYMNARIIDEEKCVGCKICIAACPFTPSRIVWNFEKRKVLKCDLCKNTPYYKGEEKPLCVAVCPTRALKFAMEVPPTGDEVNLRGEGWKKLELPTEP